MSIEIVRDGNGRVIEATARWRDPSGRQVKKTFNARTSPGRTDYHRQAREYEAEKRAEVTRGGYVDTSNKVTFEAYARQWVEARPYRGSTRENRESQLRTHVEGTRLGRMRLVAVRRSDVQAWITERTKGSETVKAASPSSVRLLLGLVRSVFAAAVDDRLIGHSPASGRFFIPAHEAEPIVPLTVEQVRKIAAEMPEELRAAVLTQATLGLRIGELLGLRVDDEIRFLQREVRITEQLHPRSRTRMPPKTPSAVRTVPLPKTTADVLAAHLAKYPAADGYVFHDEQGRPLQHVRLNRAIAAAAKKAGFPDVRSHDLRHHYASVLIDAGESVVTVAARLGHKDASIVVAVYAHLLPNGEERSRKAIDGAWSAANVPSEAKTGR